MTAALLSRMGRAYWLAFFAALLASWWALALMAVPEDLKALEGVYGAEFLQALCVGGAGVAGFPAAAAMWALMSAAMMAPTALPAFATFDDLRGPAQVSAGGFWALIGGYLTVWAGFSVIAAAAQTLLFEAGLIGSFGQSLSTGLTAALLIGAGLYQLSALKEACLSQCRAPLTFFMQHWDEGPFRNGLRLGAVCVGCCWALMLLGFVGGVMDLAFMGLAMVLMTLEKLPDIGRPLTRPLGWALICAGFAVLLF